MTPRYLVDFSTGRTDVAETDVVVVGSGIAGLFTALKAAEKHRVLLVSKTALLESNTRYAQGGIAAVFSDDDSPEYHRQDTLTAGAGLCSSAAVDVLVHEGPECVRELIALGTRFDEEENGTYALTREGAHSQRRILHARGDATGYEIVRALSERVRETAGIEVWEHHFAIDVVTRRGECIGVLVQRPDGGRVFVRARATVLCTGGAGQLYRYTTNPDIATGDGVAMAYRAGALVRDLEFVQFHPTVLTYPGAPRFLLSEALRGEGAVLRNIHGERFMPRHHPQAELAPRDIVARAIVKEMEQTNATFVYLDITHEDAEKIKQRFPNIYNFCLQYGLDLTSDWIPVAPAAHYMMGGVRTDLDGQTSVPRLYACGEVSSTGVHGANRLASNSLSEAVVFGRRIVRSIETCPPLSGKAIRIEADYGRTELLRQQAVEKRLRLQKTMLRHVGLKRNAEGLEKAGHELMRHMNVFYCRLADREEFEFANLLTCALLAARAAKLRTESRGAHFREDYPERDDVRWRKHLLFHRDDGVLEEDAADV